METLLVKPKNKKELSAVKKVLELMKIDFNNNDVYNPEFVESVLQGKEDYKNGKCKTVTIEELNSLWK